MSCYGCKAGPSGLPQTPFGFQLHTCNDSRDAVCRSDAILLGTGRPPGRGRGLQDGTSQVLNTGVVSITAARKEIEGDLHRCGRQGSAGKSEHSCLEELTPKIVDDV